MNNISISLRDSFRNREGARICNKTNQLSNTEPKSAGVIHAESVLSRGALDRCEVGRSPARMTESELEAIERGE